MHSRWRSRWLRGSSGRAGHHSWGRRPWRGCNAWRWCRCPWCRGGARCRPWRGSQCRRSGQSPRTPLRLLLSAAASSNRTDSVQHPNPDPPQHCHRHHRQGQHSEALDLFWIHRVHFVRTKTRPATSGARFGAKQSATNSPTHCSAVALSHTAHCMACRGSAVRIRLAPSSKPRPGLGFLMLWCTIWCMAPYRFTPRCSRGRGSPAGAPDRRAVAAAPPVPASGALSEGGEGIELNHPSPSLLAVPFLRAIEPNRSMRWCW